MNRFKSVVHLVVLLVLLALAVPTFAQDTIVIPNGAELATSSDVTLYAIVVGGLAVVAVAFIALSVLTAYLARNNVKLIDPTVIKDLVMPASAQLLQHLYGVALQTKQTTIDEDLVLGFARQYFNVTQNADGTITLGKLPTVTELDKNLYKSRVSYANEPLSNVSNPNPLGQ